MTDGQPNLEKMARLASAFLDTEYGTYYLTTLSELYNDEHHLAEKADSAEQKAAHVDRAAGMRRAIDLLTHDAQMLQSGYFDKKPETKPNQ